ncbi:hypothetical protein AB8O53_35885, partial [Streptomyces pilosus]
PGQQRAGRRAPQRGDGDQRDVRAVVHPVTGGTVAGRGRWGRGMAGVLGREGSGICRVLRS